MLESCVVRREARTMARVSTVCCGIHVKVFLFSLKNVQYFTYLVAIITLVITLGLLFHECIQPLHGAYSVVGALVVFDFCFLWI